LPGSKSISNRILLLAALADGETLIRDLLEADDTQVMLEALRALGVEWRREGARAVCGGDYRLKGVARMDERPIGDLVDALRQMGAVIDYLGKEGYPPLAIHPAKLRAGGEITVRGDVSSQFLTGLLLALPLTGARTEIRVEPVRATAGNPSPSRRARATRARARSSSRATLPPLRTSWPPAPSAASPAAGQCGWKE
jgi:3-phosphoshikimate 1-carboxyvinyltransferase